MKATITLDEKEIAAAVLEYLDNNVEGFHLSKQAGVRVFLTRNLHVGEMQAEVEYHEKLTKDT